MQASIYNLQGKETGSITLPDNIFAVPWNQALVHQVVTAMEANARIPVAHTKDRSEVAGTSKKPWRQKGTGRARHGSTRSPIWRKGGVAHGPRNERDFSQKINKKMRSKALSVVLSKKLKDGEILFIDALEFSEPKAKEAKKALVTLSSIKGFDTLKSKRKNAAFIALPSKDEVAQKSFRNFGNVEINEFRNINAVDILRYKYLIVADPTKAIDFLKSKASK